MKILIVGLAKIKYMPYLNFYLDSLDKSHEIHIAFWNRDGKKEDLSRFGNNVHFHEFVYEQFNSVCKLKKIKPYLMYRKYVYSLCRTNGFDFIIFLHSLAGLIVRKYLKDKRFIFDYRDTSLEKYPFYKKLIGSWAKRSLATFVSSEGFLKFLPDLPNVHLSHNLLLDSLKHRDHPTIPSNKIRIAFWGYIRNVEINKKLILSLLGDDRFELHYYGREQADALKLKEFCLKQKTSNVYFHGEYSPADRYDFVKTTDLIHNIYLDDNMEIAMGNKYYDGVIFRIPQLCVKNSLMGKKIAENGIGFVVDFDDKNVADGIADYYKRVIGEKKVFDEKCDMVLKTVLEEYDFGTKLIGSI